MREARIILPLYDNDGVDLQAVHRDLKSQVCEAFGGYTAAPVMGGWIDNAGKLYEEPGIAYDVAVEDTVRNRNLLREIALYVGREALQEAIYLRYPDGKVEIIQTAPVAMPMAA